MNKVILMGRLTRDPEVRYNGDKAVARFSLAVDRKFSDGADFPTCVAFGKTAEFIEKWFNQGLKICLEGRITTGSYTNKDGVKVYTTDVIADNVEFAESKKAGDQPQPSGDGWQEIPEGVEDRLPFD